MDIFIFIFFILAISVLLIFGLYATIPALILVGPIPSPREVIKAALEAAEIKEGEVFYDLGSGDGRVILEAVKKYHCVAVGYEMLWPVFLVSLLRVWLNKEARGKVKLYFKNFFRADLSKADVIFCYLIPHGMKKLERKFAKEKLKEGARIVSFSFPIKEWKPEQVIKLNTKTPSIYLYRIKNTHA